MRNTGDGKEGSRWGRGEAPGTERAGKTGDKEDITPPERDGPGCGA